MQKNKLTSKKVNFKSMPSQTGQQTITVHNCPISKKNNQTIKFGQLIEYNMRNNFLEKSYTKCEGGANLGPFKKIKIGRILDQQSGMF